MRKLIVVLVVGLTGAIVGMPTAQAGDTKCTGTLGPVTVDNIIVPSGALCVLEGTQVRGNALAEPASELFLEGANVRGNVEVKEDAATGAFESAVGGNYKCDKCFFEDVVESTVGGSVQIVGAQDGDFILGNVILGNVEIVDSSAGNFAFIIADNQIGGNVKFEKNAGATVIGNNQIAGQLQIVENNVAGSCTPENCGEPIANGTFSDNKVGGNMQVEKNRGATEISGNQVRGNLQCKENRPPPTGGGNTAKKKEGQCRNL